jgi:predicted nuclease of predicted toxin-antitoxin system
MTFRLLVDMNLSPAWVDWLNVRERPAVHWSRVGDARATDRTVLAWAADHGYVLFTHDLDFGAVLASSKLTGPSVVQLRAQDVTPDRAGMLVLEALARYEAELGQGALVSVDEDTLRLRLLPLR